MSKSWSGRFDNAPNAEVFAFGKSLPVDKRLIDDDIAGSRAWAQALAKAGVLTANDAEAIVSGLDNVRASVHADPAMLDRADDEDVHAFVERELVARIGDAGKRLHTGRSRNEQVSVDFRLYLRRRIPLLQRAVVSVVGAMVTQAELAGDATMPSCGRPRR